MAKKTPLFEDQKRLGARFTEFAGWKLPLSYTGIIDEHMAVRAYAGLFDISHLGKFIIKGQGSSKLLNYLATVDIDKIKAGRGAYTLFCNEAGGILDDEIIYKLTGDEYLVIPNASQTNLMLNWLSKHRVDGVEIINQSDKLGLLALQGPQSPRILNEVFDENPDNYKRYTVKRLSISGNDFTLMKSGYTGEEGFEILSGISSALFAWRQIIELGVKPAGLGARDSLRLEMGYPLYGKDLTPEITPVEAGLEKFISFEKDDFIGREVLYNQARSGVSKTLFGFVLDTGIARDGESIYSTQKEVIGNVTSGGYSPVLRRGIGLGLISSKYAQAGERIIIESRRKALSGRLKKPPFIDTKKIAKEDLGSIAS